jgi:Ca-activated chloride channel family protein
MRNREVRVAPAAALPRALVASLFASALLVGPVAPARAQLNDGGRPRRVVRPASQTAAAAQQQTTTTTQQQPAKKSPAPAQTPTPQPAASPQTTPAPGGPPKLQVQTPVKIEAAPGEKAPTEQEVNEDEVVRIESNEIKLHVRVIDRNNRPVGDVRKEEFRVFENGQPQTVTSFTKEEVPVSYGLVVDNSGSLRQQITQVIDAAKTIVESNKPGDETFVVRFVSSDDIEIKQDFTADKQSVHDALDEMFVEGGQTAVVDAVYLSSEHAAEHKKGNELDDKRRRALILVTDGEDRNSHYKVEQLFESLKERDVQIYVIGFVNELDKEGGFISKSKREKATDLLNRMAKETGGRAFYPNSLTELPGIAEEITKDLRTQYVLSYAPAVPARAGEYRQVRVAVADSPGRDKRIAITRSGYTARAGGPAPSPPAQTGNRPASAKKP